jgi:hypothetical protein
MLFDFKKPYQTWSPRQKARALDLLMEGPLDLDTTHPDIHGMGHHIISNLQSIMFNRQREHWDLAEERRREERRAERLTKKAAR